MLQGSLLGSAIRACIYQQASRIGSVTGRQLHASSRIPTKSGTFSGLISGPKIETCLQSSIMGNWGMKVGLVRAAENVPLPFALSFRSFLHSGEPPEVETGKVRSSMDYKQPLDEIGNGVNGTPSPEVRVPRSARIAGSYDQISNQEGVDGVIGTPLPEPRVRRNVRTGLGYNQFFNQVGGNGVNSQPALNNEKDSSTESINYFRGLIRENGGKIPTPADDMPGLYQGRGIGAMGSFGFNDQPQLEANADIVHIKLMRNNSYVTLTDHKGNRKVSISAGQAAAKGDKPGRYQGEAAAEQMGRLVKQMKIRSVVVKVSGFTFFKRKKDSILAFKDGYTHSRGDVNPVVYIEDTTRKPHNGCRLPKKRRI